MTTDINAAMIEQLTEALSHSRAQLQDMEADYNKLRAQVAAYERSLQSLQAVASGDFSTVIGTSAVEEVPQVRKDSYALRENIFEFFKGRPRRIESPKGLSKWLIEEKGWTEDGLRPRVSNLLRKIVKEEAWLNRAGHGKYQYVAGE